MINPATMEYLTAKQVAQLLQMKDDTLYQWRRQGEGPPFIKLGRTVRYARADVEAWLRVHRCGGEPASG